MRIGIDGRTLTGRFTGDRTYWLNLLRAHIRAAETDAEADHEYIVYSRLPIPPDMLPPSRRLTLRTVPAANDRTWTLLAFPRALKQDGVDLAHSQYTTPLRSPCPVVTTVHDISFRLYPEWFPRKHRMLLNLTVPGAMRRAKAIITVSQSSKRDILRVYRLPEEKVTAIHLAAAPEFKPMDKDEAKAIVKARFGVEKPYIIAVGVLQPRKNLPLLLEAFARARCQVDLPHSVVLAGKRGWGCQELTIHAARLRISDALTITDYVEDADLPALYSGGDIMAFPSLYEGFGLPPLEAMACGTPTLVSDAPAMPEVCGNGACILPVMDAAVWGDAIADLLTDEGERSILAERGLRRSAAFCWERTSSQTREVYDRVGREAKVESREPS